MPHCSSTGLNHVENSLWLDLNPQSFTLFLHMLQDKNIPVTLEVFLGGTRLCPSILLQQGGVVDIELDGLASHMVAALKEGQSDRRLAEG